MKDLLVKDFRVKEKSTHTGLRPLLEYVLGKDKEKNRAHDCVRGDTKTGGVRYVPLPQPLPEILGLLDDYPRDAFLMRERNSRPCATSHLQKCFYDALRKACGIDGERRKKDRITFHSLRHTAITYFRTRCGNDLYTNLVFGHECNSHQGCAGGRGTRLRRPVPRCRDDCRWDKFPCVHQRTYDNHHPLRFQPVQWTGSLFPVIPPIREAWASSPSPKGFRSRHKLT